MAHVPVLSAERVRYLESPTRLLFQKAHAFSISGWPGARPGKTDLAEFVCQLPSSQNTFRRFTKELAYVISLKDCWKISSGVSETR